jgi:hypothetical protein
MEICLAKMARNYCGFDLDGRATSRKTLSPIKFGINEIGFKLW